MSACRRSPNQAGVPKGSFYNHFESKEALGVEIVERYGMGSTRRAVLTDKTVRPLERLRTHFAALNDMFIASKFNRGCLLGNFSAELANQSPAVRDSLAQLFTKWTKDLQVAIADAQAEGSISSKAPRRRYRGVPSGRLRGNVVARSRGAKPRSL